MADLAGGHIQMFFDLPPSSVPQIEAGKVRAVANASLIRPASLPDLPTIDEQRLRGWFGRVAPAKMPEAAQVKLLAGMKSVVGARRTSPGASVTSAPSPAPRSARASAR